MNLCFLFGHKWIYNRYVETFESINLVARQLKNELVRECNKCGKKQKQEIEWLVEDCLLKTKWRNL